MISIKKIGVSFVLAHLLDVIIDDLVGYVRIMLNGGYRQSWAQER
jgi:hypothetical protein